jgi:hypothetical protein
LRAQLALAPPPLPPPLLLQPLLRRRCACINASVRFIE